MCTAADTATTAASKRSKWSRNCTVCGARFEAPPSARGKEFCSAKCRKTAWDRKAKRGAEVVDLLIAWRKGRHVKGGAAGKMGEISFIVDQWIAEDRDAAKALSAILAAGE